MTYDDLHRALAIFRLTPPVTLPEIKARHRELVKRFHPDRATEGDPEDIRAVNGAYGILRSYCENYRFFFTDDEFCAQNPDELLRRQFAQDPIWGGGE